MSKVPIDIEEVRSDLINLGFDEKLPEYKQELLEEVKAEKLVVFKNQFFYLMDMENYQSVFVHKNIKSILGYEPAFFKSLNEIFSIIHPEDYDFVLAFSKKSISYSREIKAKQLLLSNPFNISFSIDFRIRKSDGNYIRVKRDTSCVKLDKKGNMVYAISHFTDISQLQHKSYISCSWTGDDAGLFSTDDIIKEHISRHFTIREIEIIRLLADGKEGKEIARQLAISEHTVISHRKNILQKAKVSNTAELVKYSIEYGII